MKHSKPNGSNQNLNISQSQSASSSSAGGGSRNNLKNLEAMHQLMSRQGFFLPEFTSKFTNRITLLQVFNGQLFGLKTVDMVFRQCTTPPTKIVMIQKLEQYLAPLKLQSGIDLAKGNFPDKKWLILAVATLSNGRDEIFDPDYYPSKSLKKELEQQLVQPVFENIPPHLQAKGNKRGLKLHTLTKAQKVENQIKLAEARIAKQNAEHEQLKKMLQVLNSQDQEQMKKMQEREKIREQVRAEMNDQANAFVQEQLRIAHSQMQQEFERQLALQGTASKVNLFPQPPLSQNRNPHYNAASEMMELSQWEASQEPNAKSQIIEDIKHLRDKVRN